MSDTRHPTLQALAIANVRWLLSARFASRLARALIAAMLATLVALVRGIVSFLQEASAEARGEGPTASQLKSNRMMQQRIFFQALAITVVVLLLFMAGRT